MKFLSLLALVASLQVSASAQQRILNFEEFGLPLDTFLRADASHLDTLFESFDALIPSVYDTSFGGYWASGWTISTSRNDSIGNFTNLVGSITGSGNEGSSTYLVGQNKAYLLLPPNASFEGLSYSNTTYTANAVENGSFFSRPFGIDSIGNSGFPDSLILKVELYHAGTITEQFQLFLADYRFADDNQDYVLDYWNSHLLIATVILPTDSISFTLVSSDQSAFGNNTPDFFALDDLLFSIGVSATEQLAKGQPLSAFPNPITSTVTLGSGGDWAQVYISDVAGRIVQLIPDFSLGSTLDLSHLQPGTYYAIARNHDGSHAAKLMIR